MTTLTGAYIPSMTAALPGAEPSPLMIIILRLEVFTCYQSIYILAFLLMAVLNLRVSTNTAPPSDKNVDGPGFMTLFAAPKSNQTIAWFKRRKKASKYVHPLWWRESYVMRSTFERAVFLYYFLLVVVVLAMVCPVMLSVTLARIMSLPDSFRLTRLNELFRAVGAAYLLGLFYVEAFRSAAVLSQEREKQTMEMLLMVPDDRAEIARIKLFAGVWRLRWLLLGGAVYWIGNAMVGTMDPRGALLTMIAGMIHVLFASCFGMWLSQVCRSTMQAVLIAAVSVFVLTFGTFFVIPPVYHTIHLAVSPLGSWYFLGFVTEQTTNGKFFQDLVLALAGLAVYAVVGLFFYLSAIRQFCRDPLHQN